MTDKVFPENSEPEPFESPEKEIEDAESLLPNRPPILKKPLERREMKKPKPTVDVVSNDGNIATLSWSHNPSETFTYRRNTTGLSADGFLKLYPRGAKGREAPPQT